MVVAVVMIELVVVLTRGAGMRSHLLAEHSVVADFGHRSAIELRGRSQRLRPKVFQRNGVRRVAQSMEKRDVIGGDHRPSFAETSRIRSVVYSGRSAVDLR